MRDMMAGAAARVRSLWHGLRRREDVEADMVEEFHHHLALRAEDLVRSGLTPAEAARRARIEFGHLEGHREDARASRGIAFLDRIGFSWLDVKLGARMLRKYPGLSIVSVLGMAVAIAVGAGFFAFISSMLDPTLPLPKGESIVYLQNSTNNPGNPERRVLFDYGVWRDELESVHDLSAFTIDSRTLMVPGGAIEPVSVVRMTASGFRVAGVSPVLGRPIVEEDERPGAPPVLVIGYEEWHNRFDADPGVLGRTVRLGSTVHTIVGVMPQAFRFPINNRYWIPLNVASVPHGPVRGPLVHVFGRLAGGATLEQAQTELTTVGRRMAAAYPESHAQLRPMVLRYTHAFFDIESPAMALAMHALRLVVSLLLVVVAVNVAILVYARTVARTGEIAVRSALGASRRRVVTQLFAEALVLSGTAAAIGLTIAAAALVLFRRLLQQSMGGELPFWWHPRLTPGLVLYVAGLAVLAAVIVGVLPALKATGRQLQAGLQQISSRGSQMQLGRTWTALIVTQVGIAVAALPFTLFIAGSALQRSTTQVAYPADEIVRGWLTLEGWRDAATSEDTAQLALLDTRFRESASRLFARLEAEPSVAAVSFATGRYRHLELEDNMSVATIPAIANRVGGDHFAVHRVQVESGRDFTDAERRQGAHVAIVDRVLAERIGQGSVLGTRIRLAARPATRFTEGAEAGPWLEIVGVVPDFTLQSDFDPEDPQLYLPVPLEAAPMDVNFSVRVRGTAAGQLSRRLGEVAATVDPALQLERVRSAADIDRDVQLSLKYLALVVLAVTASVLLLSAAGMYAMMSFTVARRRREIGIRSALGATPRRVLSGVFARAAGQLGLGVLVGLLISAAIDRAVGGGPFVGKGVLLLPGVAVLMMLIGILAALGPARRGLSVQPTEALQSE